jgi:trigger factor
MATVTRENIGLLNEKIVVKVAKDDYLPSFDKAIKEYSKNANIHGFRKGMVPVGMVKKMYGSSVFADEVVKSVEKGLQDFMINEKLEIFAQPLPLPENDASKLDMNQPSEYAFAFEVGLKPEFNLADLANAPVTLYKVAVTDEMVNDEIKNLRVRHGKMSDEETVTSDDNVLNVTFREADAEGNLVENGITKDNSLLVSYFSPSFREQLTGKKKDDVVLVQLSQAFEEKEREWLTSDLGLSKDDPEAQNKYFQLQITKVSLIEKPDLDEAFFKLAFPAKEITSEEEFRQAVKDDIQAQWSNQSRNQLLDQIYHILLDHTQIDFPEQFLKRWIQTSGENPKTEEEVEKEFPDFVKQLKWTLIIDKVVMENNIEVKPDDLRTFARNQLLGYMGGSNIDIDQPWVNDYIEKMMKDKKYVQDSFHRIQTENVFNWAETQVKPAEAEISVDDFIRMQDEHKHHH